MNTHEDIAASALADLRKSNNVSDPSTERVTERQTKRGRRKIEKIQFPVEPRVIQTIKKPRTYMNHSYRDFSSVPSEMDFELPEEISEMTFPQKVHHLLGRDEYKTWVCWLPHGRAFHVLIPSYFEKSISEKYFGHKRYSSFLRQLSNHGFKHISQGPDRNAYYHEVSK
jgi:hypothetical protein